VHVAPKLTPNESLIPRLYQEALMSNRLSLKLFVSWEVLVGALHTLFSLAISFAEMKLARCVSICDPCVRLLYVWSIFTQSSKIDLIRHL
jgi:hypothetical protein